MKNYDTDLLANKSPKSRLILWKPIIGVTIILLIILSMGKGFSYRYSVISTKSMKTGYEITNRSDRLNYLKKTLMSFENIISRILEKVNSDQPTNKEASEMKELLERQAKDIYLNIHEEVKYTYESFSTELTLVNSLSYKLGNLLKDPNNKKLERPINTVKKDLKVIVNFLGNINMQLEVILSAMNKNIKLPTKEKINFYVDLLIGAVKRRQQIDPNRLSTVIRAIDAYRNTFIEYISKIIEFKKYFYFYRINNLIGDTLNLMKVDNIEEDKFLELINSWSEMKTSYEVIVKETENVVHTILIIAKASVSG